MRDGYHPFEGEDGASSGLDEFLCEYVDGTMDPVVRAAFEDYLRANPDLYEHIDCLRRTRSMLCRYGCQMQAPPALQQRLRERLGEELLGVPPVLPSIADRLRWMAGISSVLLVLCGFLLAQHGPDLLEPAVVKSAVASPDARTMNGYLVPHTAYATAASSSAGIPIFARKATGMSFHSHAVPSRDTFLTSATLLRTPAVVTTLP